MATALAAFLCGCADWAAAGPNLVDMQVVDRENGQILQQYPYNDRLFVAGRPGARYALRVQNRTAGRVMVVLSVDGVNVITGQTAAHHQTGYVLEPWRSYDLNGWRKSDTEIAAFEFASLGQSYAAKTGRPGNVGVIGMAVFEEKPLPPPPPVSVGPSIAERKTAELAAERDAAQQGRVAAAPAATPPALTRDSAAAARAESNAGASVDGRSYESEPGRRIAPAPSADKLGTAHGQREWSVSGRTQFERATLRPASVRSIEYDQYENLVAMGVVPTRYSGQRPRPFPSSRDQPGFVPDPPQNLR
ncbi:hypothetical protein [Ottowia sp.]|uniref:hypothetical protein n=1 Tax=Ottowia sp. TaxID=1898956 RepID=UPI0025DFD6FF|nr:hypothetical protein [Ottowia sp.]MBK6616576.1 hypothetical protein [Ottowia sp.]